MKYTAQVFGKINDKPLLLRGSGEIDLSLGKVYGTYNFHEIASGIDTLIFNSVLVTGYPSACRSPKGFLNPFQMGSYSYERHVEFDEEGLIVYSALCSLDEECQTLTSHFEVDARLPSVSLAGCLPIVETWTPNTGGGIQGTFAIAWSRHDGTLLRACALTAYSLPGAAPPLATVHKREIVLTNRKPAVRQLYVEQDSVLFPL